MLQANRLLLATGLFLGSVSLPFLTKAVLYLQLLLDSPRAVLVRQEVTAGAAG